MDNIINVYTFEELYKWFENNSDIKDYVWVNTKRGKPNNIDFSYIDAVYCALCFGWIDSTCKNIDGITYQKLMPRSKNSHWTYLNIARCKYLIDKGLMTEKGMKEIPLNYNPLKEHKEIVELIKKDKEAWTNFKIFPLTYQQIRIDNIKWAIINKDNKTTNNRISKLIQTSKENKMYGEWNDYGRLE